MNPSLAGPLLILPLILAAVVFDAEAQTVPVCTPSLIVEHTECPPNTICDVIAETTPEPVDEWGPVLERLRAAQQLPRCEVTLVAFRVTQTGAVDDVEVICSLSNSAADSAREFIRDIQFRAATIRGKAVSFPLVWILPPPMEK